MEKLSLQEIAKGAGADCPAEWADIAVEDICTDTRKITPGCLFIALKGERFDGHEFVDKAFEQGAAAALVHRPVLSEYPVLRVEDTRRALLNLARFYRKRFSVFLVGITGSVGKTSTKEMIYSVLSQKAKTLKTQGNFNNEIGLPMTLFGLDSSYRAAVIEMGMSAFGEISRLSCTAMPSLAVITNIGVSHMEHLGSRENILKAKLEILDGLQGDLPLILNGDDDMLATVGEFVDREIIYYGIDSPDAGVTASDIAVQDLHTTFTISYFGKKVQAKIPTVGRHHVYNALAAFCVGLVADMPEEEILRGLSQYKPTGLRQHITTVDGITIIADCYNASPDSMGAALSVLDTLETKGRRIAVLGDMLELGEISEKAHYKVGVMAGQSKADEVLCYGPQSENIARGAMSEGMTKVMIFQDKQELSRYLQEHTVPGDTVLFKASRGMKLEEVMENTYGGELKTI